MRLLVCLLCAGLVAGGLDAARAQPLPDAAADPTLEAACRGAGARVSLWLLRWAARSQPLPPSRRAALDPLTRAAYRLVEAHYVPYRDPHMRSTWDGRYAYAVVQPSLQVDVAADSSFRRWERHRYALDLNWNAPPLLRSQTVEPFRPRLGGDTLTTLYATPDRTRALVDFFLPLGAVPTAALQRRIDCVKPHLGLTDWVRTDRDAHSPPAVRLLVNASRTRAIAAYGWGVNGGVWVLYRRSAPRGAWHEVRPLGGWSYTR